MTNNIKVILLDVDGVLTNGQKTYHEDGTISKIFSVYDGKGIQLAQRAGIKFAILTADPWPIKKRAKDLNIRDVFTKCHDKVSLAQSYINVPSRNVVWENVCFIGDDVNDIELLELVGFPATVYNAMPKVKQIVQERDGYISQRSGGDGAVREIIDLILESK